MLVTLTARGFRNLRPISWQLEPGRHIVLGDNGAGKTSLLEAVYLLASTKSFRTSQLSDCCQIGAATFELDAEVDEASRIALSVHWSRYSRHRHVNGRPAPLVEHLDVLPLVIWTSLDAEALTGEPKARRRILDRGLVGLRPSTLSTLSRYKRTLAAKRAELLSGGRELHLWNSLLAAAAADLMALRNNYQSQLSQQFAEVLEESGLDLPDVRLEYRPSPAEGLDGASQLEAQLTRVADQERRRGEALIGPHRDEWVLTLGGSELRRRASAGERRALGILLAVAHGRLLHAAGRQALFLLDDVDAELSTKTLAAVWKTLHSAPQVLATSSRPRVWEDLGIDRCWGVEAGTLKPI